MKRRYEKFQKFCAFLAVSLLQFAGLCTAAEVNGLKGGIWSRIGETPPYLEADPAASSIVVSDKVVQLEPHTYLRDLTLRAFIWIDNDRYVAEVESDTEGNHPLDEQRRIVVVDTRSGEVRETAHRGRTFCYRDGKLISKVTRSGKNVRSPDGKITLDGGSTTFYEGPLDGPIEPWTWQHGSESVEIGTCERVPNLATTLNGSKKLKELALPGWALNWTQPKPLREQFGALIKYEREGRTWSEPELTANSHAQALANKPFTSKMRVASGIYTLAYITPSGKLTSIPLNPGEDVLVPHSHDNNGGTRYFATEDAYFFPMLGALVPFGLPAELRSLPRFARLLYRDGRVRLFSPPKVLWEEALGNRAVLQGHYSAAGLIWIKISGPERKKTYYLQKGNELLRIEGLPQQDWFVMPDGCHVHMSAIDRQETYYSTFLKQAIPFTLNRYMTANLCQ